MQRTHGKGGSDFQWRVSGHRGRRTGQNHQQQDETAAALSKPELQRGRWFVRDALGDKLGHLFLSPGPACRRWGADSRGPGPGVVTVRRTLKRDIPRLLTQHEGKNQWALCGVETVESILSANGLCPVPSVLALQHGRSQPAAHCGHCWTRVTPSVWTIRIVVTLCFLADLLGSSLFIDAQQWNNSSADDEIRRRLGSD